MIMEFFCAMSGKTLLGSVPSMLEGWKQEKDKILYAETVEYIDAETGEIISEKKLRYSLKIQQRVKSSPKQLKKCLLLEQDLKIHIVF